MDYGSLLGAAMAVVVPVVGFVVWLVRLEGRINLERELRGALEARLNGFEQRISAALDRIESKLDAKADK